MAPVFRYVSMSVMARLPSAIAWTVDDEQRDPPRKTPGRLPAVSDCR